MEQDIHTAYRGEIYGIAFFTYFANHYQNKSLASLWVPLIEVEHITAARLEHELTTLGIPYLANDVFMQNKGVEDASLWIQLPPAQLIDILLSWIEPYEHKYRLWFEEQQGNRTLEFIAEHETAIYQCWKAQKNNQSGIEFLHAFINKYTTET